MLKLAFVLLSENSSDDESITSWDPSDNLLEEDLVENLQFYDIFVSFPVEV